MKMKEIQDKYLYKSYEVGLLVAARANEQRFVINATKLQKLLFITYGSYLAVHNKRLTDEHPQSWPSGPVFPKFREDFIAEDFSTVLPGDKRISSGAKNDRNLAQIIQLVFKGFGGWTVGDLTAWCIESVPCQATPDNGQTIDDNIIRTFFNSLINK